MRVCIIGNGLAAVTVASNLFNLDVDNSIQIDIFTEEKYPYYSRVKLVEFLMGHITQDELIVYDMDWYEQREINLHLNSKVVKVDPKKNKIFIEKTDDDSKEEVEYDILVIATGSKPIIPRSPMEEPESKQTVLSPVHRGKNGWHVLRWIDDALGIREHLKQAQRIIILGSGLLGLELAHNFREGNRSMDTSIIEIEPLVSPAYLDKQGSLVVTNLLERAGIKILLKTKVVECTGENDIEGCRLSDKTIHKGDLVIFACGIRPNTDFLIGSGIKMMELPDIVEESENLPGLGISRPILVNEFLQTNIPNVYAVGDCAEYEGFMYGINPAAIEQAKHCAYNIIKPGGKKKAYDGTVPSVSFQGFDTELISLGRVNDYTIDQEEWDEIFSYYKVDLTLGEYKKILIKNDRIIGAILVGDLSTQLDIRRMIMEKIDVSGFVKEILQDGFQLRNYI
ncbi:MAG: NAD(P)/FAD-dependent oxidoreductase [Promethearchaeota archaeon]